MPPVLLYAVKNIPEILMMDVTKGYQLNQPIKANCLYVSDWYSQVTVFQNRQKYKFLSNIYRLIC